MRLALHTIICCCVIAAVLPVPVEDATGDASLKKRWESDLFPKERQAAPWCSPLTWLQDQSVAAQPQEDGAGRCCRGTAGGEGEDYLTSIQVPHTSHLEAGSLSQECIKASENGALASFSFSARASISDPEGRPLAASSSCASTTTFCPAWTTWTARRRRRMHLRTGSAHRATDAGADARWRMAARLPCRRTSRTLKRLCPSADITSARWRNPAGGRKKDKPVRGSTQSSSEVWFQLH